MTRTVNTAPKATASKVAPAQDAKSIASSIGDYLGSKEFAAVTSEIEHLLEIKEEERVGPLTLFQKMQDAGIDFDKLPRVGTSYKDYIGKDKPNFVLETIQIWDATKGKMVDANSFTIMWAAAPLGIKYQAIIDDINLALDPKTANQSKLYAHLSTDNAFLVDDKKLYTGRMQAGKNLLRTAVLISNQWDRLDDCSSVVVKLNTVKDKDGNEQMKRTKYPFKMCEAGNESVFKPLTISDFVNIKTTDKEGNDIDTFKGLLDTLATGAEPNGQEQDKVKQIIPSDEKAEEYMLALLNRYNGETEEGLKHRSSLLAHLALPANEASLKHWGDTLMALDPIWTYIQPLYDKLSLKTIGNRAAVAAAFAKGNDKQVAAS